jgi:Na+/H+ antiporter NhaC
MSISEIWGQPTPPANPFILVLPSITTSGLTWGKSWAFPDTTKSSKAKKGNMYLIIYSLFTLNNVLKGDWITCNVFLQSAIKIEVSILTANMKFTKAILLSLISLTLTSFCLTGQSIRSVTHIGSGEFEVTGIGIGDSARLTVNGEETAVFFTDQTALWRPKVSLQGQLIRLSVDNGSIYRIHLSQKGSNSYRLVKVPSWTAILPPVIAIILALLLKEVLFSLFLGVLAGSFVINGYRFDGIFNTFYFVFDAISGFILNALNDAGHLSVIVFSILIGGMVSLITKNGGMMGVLEKATKYAVSRQRVQMMTYILGIAIFFDDYANTLIVGNTMRSLTDKFRISREKLAYIVDSTAAPISAIAFITTWIGAELGFISGGLDALENYSFSTSPYLIFLQSLKYSFYPILTLIFIYVLIKVGKDYGPMLEAERRAANTGQVMSDKQVRKDEPNMEDLDPVEGAPLKWTNAFWPVITTIAMTMIGLLVTGMNNAGQELADSGRPVYGSWSETWANISKISGGEGFMLNAGTLLGMSDSYQALLWASFSGLAVAVLLTVGQKIMNLWDASHWALQGFKTMLPAVVILILAWSLAATTESLGTADYVIHLFGDNFHPAFIPMIIFIMAFVISFSTGSSWSTMAILYPLAIPLAWKISLDYGFSAEDAQEILLNAIATVLAASVLGDHCSPISDTTILSSLASDCNHLDHVRTQLPYAATVGIMALICVSLAAFIGGSWLLTIILIIVSTFGFWTLISLFGKSAEEISQDK